MISIDKLMASFREILGWPYASPGTNDEKGIDCSGAFVRAYGQQGAAIYHGSNRIARAHVTNLRQVKSLTDIQPGEAVFKCRDDVSALSADYLPGGRYHNPGIPWDCYHIGLRVPEGIIHATTPAAKLDTALGAWKLAGRLTAATYEKGETPMTTTITATTATVAAEGGVRMRQTPNPTGAYMKTIPQGKAVRVLETLPTGWCKVDDGAHTGYVTQEYLQMHGEMPGGQATAYAVTIPCATREEAETLTRLFAAARIMAA